MEYGEHHLQVYDSCLGQSRELTPQEIAARVPGFLREQSEYQKKKALADKERGCDGWVWLVSQVPPKEKKP